MIGGEIEGDKGWKKKVKRADTVLCQGFFSFYIFWAATRLMIIVDDSEGIAMTLLRKNLLSPAWLGSSRVNITESQAMREECGRGKPGDQNAKRARKNP